jgi:hypothetical protein
MIGIVYHCYLVNNWKEIVKQQLSRVKDSGLYDAADLFYITVNRKEESQEVEFKELVAEYSKVQIEFFIHNSYEYPGIKKVKELGDQYDDLKILYFHAKGVSNNYIRPNQPEISEKKVRNIRAWSECLEYFLIDKWKESVDKLDEFDNVGVTCIYGWYWGNFWWSQSKHIKKCNDVGMWGRWDYEAWLNREVENSNNFEWYNFTFNPYITFLDSDFYKEHNLEPSKIVLHKATYGPGEFEIDEGYSNYPLNTNIDVFNIVDEKLKEQNYEKFLFRVDNETMVEDPAFGYRKALFLEFSLEKYPEKIYELGINENFNIDFKI